MISIKLPWIPHANPRGSCTPYPGPSFTPEAVVFLLWEHACLPCDFPFASTPHPRLGSHAYTKMADQKKDAAKAAEKPKEEDGPNMKVIYWTVFLDFFAMGLVLPLLQGHARSSLGATGFNVGMVFSAYSFASIAGSFIFGRLSDYIGRRPVILISLFMSTVTLYFTAIAPTLDQLILTRAVAGFFSETSVCQAYIADKTTLEDRPKYLGHMGAFIGLAFMVGPATGALIGTMGGFEIAAQFTTFVTAINFVYAYVSLDESLATRELEADEQTLRRGAEWSEYFATLFQPRMLLVMVSQFLCTVAFMGWDTTYGIFAAERLGYSRKHVGWAFAWLALALILAMWKMRAIVKKSDHLERAAAAGCLCMAVGLVAHRVVYSTLASLIPLFILGFGYGLSELAYQTVVSLSSNKLLQVRSRSPPRSTPNQTHTGIDAWYAVLDDRPRSVCRTAGCRVCYTERTIFVSHSIPFRPPSLSTHSHTPHRNRHLFDTSPDDDSYCYTVLGALPFIAAVLSPLLPHHAKTKED